VDEQKVSSKVIPAIEAGRSETIPFVIELPELGQHVISAVINGASGRIPTDDVRRTVLTVTSGVQVLLVDGEPGARFGEGEVDYLDALLSPQAGMGGAIPGGAHSGSGFTVTRVTAEAFLPLHVQGKDIVVLANVPTVPPPIATSLRDHVVAGMGLLVFLGDQVMPSDYRRLFGASDLGVGAGESTELLPAEIGARVVRGNDETPLRLSGERLEHPWMALFRTARNRSLLRSPIMGTFALDVPEAPHTRVVAFYEDNAPAIVERTLGDGRVVLFGTSADPEWNEMFREPLGPILVRCIVSALIPGSRVPRTVEVGDEVSIPLSAQDHAASLTLVLPDGRTRDVEATRVDNVLRFSWSEPERAGVYRLEVNGPVPRQEMLVRNPSVQESVLTAVAPSDLPDLFPGGEIRLLAARGAFGVEHSLSKKRMGRELWWPALAACLTLFLLEITLARLFTPELGTTRDLPPIVRQAMRSASRRNRPVLGRSVSG
jgi:hypothetical protein